MGVYHCDECGETLLGETYDCEECGCGGGDGTVLCVECADNHCLDASQKSYERDVQIVEQLLSYGVYLENNKYSAPRGVQDPSLRAVLSAWLEAKENGTCAPAAAETTRAEKGSKTEEVARKDSVSSSAAKRLKTDDVTTTIA